MGRPVWVSLLVIALVSACLISPSRTHATVISLVGDKDNFGTGAPLGSPINSWIGVNDAPIHPDATDGLFDSPGVLSPVTWTHLFSLSGQGSITAATLTIVTWDLEDGGQGDGSGGGPYDTTLFLDGIEIPGAFDQTYSPDMGPSYPNITTFTLSSSLYSLLRDGRLDVTLNPSAGTGSDFIAIDYAELRIETRCSPVPEPSTLLLLGSGLGSLFAFSSRTKRQRS